MQKAWHKGGGLALTFLLILGRAEFLQAQQRVKVVNPQLHSKAVGANVYNMPGIGGSSTFLCDDQTNDCLKLTWLSENTEVEIKGAVTVEYNFDINKRDQWTFFQIHYRDPETGNPQVGWLREDYLPGARVPEDCSTRVFSSLRGQINELNTLLAQSLEVPKIKKEKLPSPPSLGELKISVLSDSQVYSRRCHNFIAPNGSLGPWGQKLVREIERIDRAYSRKNGKSCFFETIDFSEACPNFDNFSKDLKKRFWAFVYASIAQDESSCDPTQRNDIATNGIADGLMQLEYSRSDRARAGRDSQLCKTQESVNSQNIDFQLQCSATILRDVHCGKIDWVCNRGKGRSEWCVQELRKINSRNSYWEQLSNSYGGGRTQRGDIYHMLKRFPGCS